MPHDEIISKLRSMDRATFVVAEVDLVRAVPFLFSSLNKAFSLSAELMLPAYAATRYNEVITPSSPQEREARRLKVRDVQLTRSSSGLGFTVTSDADGRNPRVGSVVAGGSAAHSSMVFQGDRILAINGFDVRAKHHNDVVVMLMNAEGKQVHLTLEGDASPLPPPAVISPRGKASTRNVTLQRPVNGRGMGLALIYDANVRGLRVAAVTPGSEADRCGRVRVGDVLEAINGCPPHPPTPAAAAACMLATPEVELQLRGEAQPLPFEAASSVAAEATTASASALPVGGDERRVVQLTRTDDGAGFGMKVSSLAADECGACITTVLPGGAAELSELVYENDVIVAVDGVDVLSTPHDDIIQMLVGKQSVQLTLSSDLSLLGLELVPDRRTVELRRGSVGLGMRIVTDEEAGAVRVAAVIPGGAAADTGLVFVGDVIEEVNGSSMMGVTHDTAVLALSAQDAIRLVLMADDSPLRDDDEDTLDLAATTVEDVRVASLEANNGLPGNFGMQLGAVRETQGVVILTITEGGAAHANGLLLPGDVIVEVDGENVLEAPLEAVMTLLLARRRVLLAVSSDAALLCSTALARHASLKRGEQGLGLRVSTDESIGLVRVTEVLEGGPAAESRKIEVGDIIISVGGCLLRGLGHADVVGLLSGRNPVELVLLPCLAPLDFFEDTENQDASGTGTWDNLNGEDSPVSSPTPAGSADGSPRGSGALVSSSTSPADIATTNGPNARRPIAANSPGQEQAGGVPRTVLLRRGRHGFGLSLATDSSVNGLIVANVAKGGVAAVSCQVYVGDVILFVNGISTEGMSQADAVAIFAAEAEVSLRVVSGRVVIRTEENEPPSPFALRTVSLRRNDRGLGLHLMQDMGGEVSGVGWVVAFVGRLPMSFLRPRSLTFELHLVYRFIC
jgi:C-terminal processing protease CtpA/Prc